MRFLNDTGFVIKRVNVGETDRFITVFTKNHGKQELIAKGVRKISSRRASHLELLNKIKFNSIKTRKNYILTENEVINAFSNIKDSHLRIGYIFLICELIDKLCPYNQKHEDIFDLINSVSHDLKEANFLDHIHYFQKKLLTVLGFWDSKRNFASLSDIEQYIELITERRLKSKAFLYLLKPY